MHILMHEYVECITPATEHLLGPQRYPAECAAYGEPVKAFFRLIARDDKIGRRQASFRFERSRCSPRRTVLAEPQRYK